MRRPLLITALMVVCSIFVFGCSREEQSAEPTQDAGVVKQAIEKPLKQKIQTLETKATEEKGSKPEPALQASAPQRQEQTRPLDEKRQEIPPLKTEAEPGETRATRLLLQLLLLAGAEPAQVRAAAKSMPKETVDFYVVEPGDTLAGIAAKKEVFGNPLKWTILYRLNAGTLKSLPPEDNLPDLPLSPGTKLRIVGPEEAREKIDTRSGCLWAVNVVSATTKSEMVPAVISLARKDYPVYVVSARVNEKDYMRVRVGFFKTREQADAESVKIREMLNLKESWVTRMSMGEFAEFAGY